jgi:hypothetical protein
MTAHAPLAVLLAPALIVGLALAPACAGRYRPEPIAPERLAIDEPLRGQTKAEVRRDPGRLTPEGWQVTTKESQLRWDLGKLYRRGTVEFEVRGHLEQEDKRILFALWDVEEGAENQEKGTGNFFQIRLMDEGMMLRLTARGKVKTIEKHTGLLAWPSPDTWVHVKATFDTREGQILRLWRDGKEMRVAKLRGGSIPGFRYAFLGRDNYGDSYEAVPGFTFRNLKVYDLE